MSLLEQIQTCVQGKMAELPKYDEVLMKPELPIYLRSPRYIYIDAKYIIVISRQHVECVSSESVESDNIRKLQSGREFEELLIRIEAEIK